MPKTRRMCTKDPGGPCTLARSHFLSSLCGQALKESTAQAHLQTRKVFSFFLSPWFLAFKESSLSTSYLQSQKET